MKTGLYFSLALLCAISSGTLAQTTTEKSDLSCSILTGKSGLVAWLDRLIVDVTKTHSSGIAAKVTVEYEGGGFKANILLPEKLIRGVEFRGSKVDPFTGRARRVEVCGGVMDITPGWGHPHMLNELTFNFTPAGDAARL